MDAILQRGFTPVALQQIVECGFAFEDLMESAHGTVSASVPQPGSGVEHHGRSVI